MSLLQKSIIMFIIVTHIIKYKLLYYSFKVIKQYCKVTKATNKKQRKRKKPK